MLNVKFQPVPAPSPVFFSFTEPCIALPCPAACHSPHLEGVCEKKDAFMKLTWVMPHTHKHTSWAAGG